MHHLRGNHHKNISKYHHIIGFSMMVVCFVWFALLPKSFDII